MLAIRTRRLLSARLARWDVIDTLLARRRAPVKFLEIGVLTGDCGRMVKADRKVGVDLVAWDAHHVRRKYDLFFKGSSDSYFAQNREKFDCIFIDAEHTYKQASKDFANASRCLKKGGYVVMHDTNPPSFEYHRRTDRTGDVWRTVVALRKLPDFNAYTVDIETGVTVIEKRKNENPLTLSIADYKQLAANRVTALGLIGAKEWLRCYGG